MSRLLRFLQLNAQKQRNVQLSMMNDVSLKDYAALIISEPHVVEMNGKEGRMERNTDDRMVGGH
jgi:hypothetical protein